MTNLNRVLLIGNLTKDPEVYTTPSDFTITTLRLAVNTRRKGADGTWDDKPNFFDIKVMGKSGENAGKFLSKGSKVAVDGHLEWREWETSEGKKGQAVEVIVAMDGNIEFLPSGGPRNDDGGGASAAPVTSSGGDDDLPF